VQIHEASVQITMINTVLLSLILYTHALSSKQEGYSLSYKNKTCEYCGCCGYLHSSGWLVSSAILKYYVYNNNPIYSIRMTTLSETALMSCFYLKVLVQCWIVKHQLRFSFINIQCADALRLWVQLQ